MEVSPVLTAWGFPAAGVDADGNSGCRPSTPEPAQVRLSPGLVGLGFVLLHVFSTRPRGSRPQLWERRDLHGTPFLGYVTRGCCAHLSSEAGSSNKTQKRLGSTETPGEASLLHAKPCDRVCRPEWSEQSSAPRPGVQEPRLPAALRWMTSLGVAAAHWTSWWVSAVALMSCPGQALCPSPLVTCHVAVKSFPLSLEAWGCRSLAVQLATGKKDGTQLQDMERRPWPEGLRGFGGCSGR